MKNNVKIILLYVVLIALIFLAVSFLYQNTKEEPLVYSDVVAYFKEDAVESFIVSEDYLLTMKLTDGTSKSYQLRSLEIFHTDLAPYIKGNVNLIEYEYEPLTTYPWWTALLPYAIVIIILVALWFYMASHAADGKGGAGRMNSFGKAKVKMPQNDKNRVLFSDVAGADEEKAELQEIVEFLKEPVKFARLGAKIPHGVLLVGPPGTGKTLLAKAVAGEAGVPFFSISGSDFVEMYVGVGASRVRDLFDNARKSPASIIFIDEIDAVGRHRGAGLGGGHDEREQTLNQLLVEMDGFGSHEGIIVLAATNRPDILDPALLRPGRFDRRVTVNVPDIIGRTEILKIHARNKPFEDSVNLETVAKTTVGFTGADLANLLNEAALLAATRGKNLIGMDEIEDSFIKIIAGPKKKSRKMGERELKNTAYHEAGHAIVSYNLPTGDPVHQISIIPSGHALGYTLNLPTEDKFSVYKQELTEQITELLGGRAAEKIIFGDVSGGASNDIQRATEIAKKMVMQLGMSDIMGTIAYGSDHGEVFLGRDFSNNRDYSDQTAAKIDAEIHRIVEESYQNAIRILTENIDKLHFVAEFLLKNEIMDGDQFKAAMEGTCTIEEIEQIAIEKKRASEEANRQRALENEERRRREEEEAQRKMDEEEERRRNEDTHW